MIPKVFYVLCKIESGTEITDGRNFLFKPERRNRFTDLSQLSMPAHPWFCKMGLGVHSSAPGTLQDHRMPRIIKALILFGKILFDTFNDFLTL